VEQDVDIAPMNMKKMTRQQIQEEIIKAMRQIAKLQEKIYHLARRRDSLNKN